MICLFNAVWALGFAMCVGAFGYMIKEIKRQPFGTCAGAAPAVAGFAFFPLANFAAFALAVWAIRKDRHDF